MTPSSIVLVVVYLAIALVRSIRDRRAKRRAEAMTMRNNELERQVIDLRERINDLEDYPLMEQYLKHKRKHRA